MSSDSGGRILIALGIGFFSGVYNFYKGLNSFRLKRLVENTPTSSIRSLAMGLIEVCGEAMPASAPLKSPFTQADCVYYRYKIQELRSSGKHSRYVTIAKGESKTMFYAQDETGKVLIDPKGAEVDIPCDFKCKTGFFHGNEMPDTLINFLNNKKIEYETKGFLGGKKDMIFEEWYIAPGDRLYILGNADKKKGVKSEVNEDSIIIKKGRQNFYYISDTTEYKVKNHLRNESLLKIYGGATLSVICLGLLLLYLRIL